MSNYLTNRVQWLVCATCAIGLCLVASTPQAQVQAQPRLNGLVSLLAAGKVAFGAFQDTSPTTARAAASSIDDFILYEMEHEPYDVSALRTYLQFLLDPAAILKRGRPGTDHPLIVRVPAYGREMNQWMAKQVLDLGVHGVMFSTIETPEQAVNAIKSMRYTQRPGSPDLEPNGWRGSGYGAAARYWGIPNDEYTAKADLWPLDPNGELVSMLLIENELGVKNIREILKVKGISVIVAGPSDLSVSYGGDAAKTEAGLKTIVAACKEFNVPCAIPASTPAAVTQRINEGYRVIIGSSGEARQVGRKLAGR